MWLGGEEDPMRDTCDDCGSFIGTVIGNFLALSLFSSKLSQSPKF
jgi:hypothetical protein